MSLARLYCFTSARPSEATATELRASLLTPTLISPCRYTPEMRFPLSSLRRRRRSKYGNHGNALPVTDRQTTQQARRNPISNTAVVDSVACTRRLLVDGKQLAQFIDEGKAADFRTFPH